MESRRRPSVTSRFSYAVSNAESGEALDEPTAAAHQQIEEEIAEIKRYEDAARERQRRKARQKRTAGLYTSGKVDWRHKLFAAYEAAQGWIVITLIGAAIGVNAAFLNIITEWLSDIKLGHCTTAFYLNEKFCCWGEDNGCPQWRHWTGFRPLNYVIYIIFAVRIIPGLPYLGPSLRYAPYAAGSGISEIKCIIAGFVMKGFLSFWTLLIKSICLPLAIASGLSVGKEGPSVHYAVCTGNVISRLFNKYRRSASKTREILSACAAAGVAVAFGSPIGGVLFSLEEMSSYFPLKTMWRSYFCALVATLVLAAMNPFRTGQLVMFQVTYDRSWHFFETPFYVIIGVMGGLYGAFVIKWNLRYQAFRKKYLAQYPILESTLLALATAIVCYHNVFLRIDMTQSMEILFLECEGTEDYHGLCDAPNRLWNIMSLFSAAIIRIAFVIISYGCKVPAGIFVPSMAVGASFGRAVGIIVQALHDANPNSSYFAACEPDVPCITPGTYAFLGAAASLSGIMNITVSVVVIMFELTGALVYILPTMIVVGVTKAVTHLIGCGGIADRMIWFSGMPFLDNKEEHNFGVPVSHAMTSKVVSIPVSGLTFQEVKQLLASGKYQGFPVVENEQNKILVGYIGRTELQYAIDRLEKEPSLNPLAKCTFSPTYNAVTPATPSLTIDTDPVSSTSLDFSRYVDSTPVTVHPRLPLETVMELFSKIGPRVVLIEYHGQLTGLLTVKDCLKYQFKVEAAEHPRDDQDIVQSQERLWAVFQGVGGWISTKVSRVSGGRVQLGSNTEVPDGFIMDGTEQAEEDGLELEDREQDH
ncbi:glycerol ethanol, ferric requiring protein [Cytospora paraplurivora]|uniref:Chloride channel protein n=1 Tax=Cytospora paraplurivora TaxID=2898453 RepID=A0AAN9YNM6_9PEZI